MRYRLDYYVPAERAECRNSRKEIRREPDLIWHSAVRNTVNSLFISGPQPRQAFTNIPHLALQLRVV